MLDVVVLFFLLGVAARLCKSDLRLPESLYDTVSIYLLLAIGLKGGIELSRQPLAALAPQVLACMLLSFGTPFLLYPLFRALKLGGADAASLGAHYGSVSVVTFAVATAELARAGIAFESHAALWVAVMEAPGLVAGVLLVRLARSAATLGAGLPQQREPLPDLLREALFSKSILLLGGGLLIGAVAGVEGARPLEPVFMAPFKGVLALFLLELGLVAGARIGEVRRFGPALLLIGLAVPPVLAVLGGLVGRLLGLSTGGIALMATLASSASYIAAPTAMRIAVPEANFALSITAVLGITFPFNIVVGIPLYIALARHLNA